MPENDLLMMSLVIFIPSVFALGLIFFPKGTEEWMRWFALLGTALTFVVSLFMLVDYTKILSTDTSDPSRLAMHGDAATLDYRVAQAAGRSGQERPPEFQ